MEKWIIENPAKGVKKFHEEKRENWLSVDPIRCFRDAFDQYNDQSAAKALRLLRLTGSRAGKVLKATWEESDLQRGVWTKPSYHTKQKKTEHVLLSATAVDLLKSTRPMRADGPAFPGKVVEGEKQRRARSLSGDHGYRHRLTEHCTFVDLALAAQHTSMKEKSAARAPREILQILGGAVSLYSQFSASRCKIRPSVGMPN